MGGAWDDGEIDGTGEMDGDGLCWGDGVFSTLTNSGDSLLTRRDLMLLTDKSNGCSLALDVFSGVCWNTNVGHK